MEEEELVEAEGVQMGVGNTGRGEVEIDDNEFGYEGRDEEREDPYRRSTRERQLSHPRLVPQFQPLIHLAPRHEQQADYPKGFNVNAGVLTFFRLFFFDNAVFEQLVQVTNLCASFEHAGNPEH